MYRFKEYTVIAEGKTAGAEMEKVIAVCSELYPKGKKTFDKEILTRPEIKLFLSLAKKPFSVAGLKINNKADAEKLKKIFFDFGKVINQKTTGNIDAGAGQSKPEVSKFWTEITEKKKDTSKADIMIGRNKVSVKAPVAQIMSGKKKETKATVLAAAEASGLQKSIQKALFAEVDKFVESSETNSKKINVGALKKMTAKQAKESGNAHVKELVDNQDASKQQIINVFKDAFKDEKFAYAFAREAMTGSEKFGGEGGNDIGEATHYLIWDYSLRKLRYTPIDKKLIGETAKKMKPEPSMKSASFVRKTKGEEGYRFFQAFRAEVKTVLGKMDEVEEEANEQVELHRRMLTEGYINENRFMDTVKKIYTAAKNKIVGLAKKLMEKIVAIAKKAKEVIQKGIKETLEMFEIDISSVRVNTEVRFKV
tara:strand:- start:29 stop:1297 length:1269 start_codon:yes stop_codon:yes gene_type:complete